MSRTIRAFLPVPGEPDALLAAFAEDPEKWLPEARRTGPHRWQLPLRAGSFSRLVELSLGDPWRSGATSWRTCTWQPSEHDDDTLPVSKLLPAFDGEIGLHIAADGATLLLDGRYQPPGSVLGEALDALGLHNVARATADRLVADVSARLSAAALLVRR